MYCCVRFKKLLICSAAAALLAAAVCFSAVRLGLDHTEAAAANAENKIFLPVIMYHSLLKDPDRAGDYVLNPDIFKEDMRYLTENGYTTILIRDLLNYLENGAPLPEKPIIVTFDDGYYNVMEYAYPFMRENGLKGVVNIVGAYSEQSAEEDEHNPAYSYLTWEEIAELDKSGIFEIGNHTYDMHSMTGRKGCRRLYSESAEEYRRALSDDIGGLQNMLKEKSGVTAVTFAYPYGFISEESTEILGGMGFRVLLTCYEKPNFISHENAEGLLILNRYNRPSGISSEDFFEKVLAQ